MEGKVGTQNPSPRGCTYSSLLRTAEVSTPHLALRPGRGSPGVTVRLGTSHRLGQCKELCAGHTAVRRILLLRPHVSARARPASRPAPPWSRPFPGRLCLTGDGESFPPPPIPRPSAKKQAHTGVSLTCSFTGRAGRPNSTAVRSMGIESGAAQCCEGRGCQALLCPHKSCCVSSSLSLRHEK